MLLLSKLKMKKCEDNKIYFSFVKIECLYDLYIIYFPTKLSDNQYWLGLGYFMKYLKLLSKYYKLLTHK